MTWTFSQHSGLLLQKSQDESILTFYKNVEVKPKHLMSRQEIPAYDNVLQHDDFNSIIPNVCCWCSHFLWQILVGSESSCSLQSWLYGNWTVLLSQRTGGGGCTVAEIYNCMLMLTEVNSKTHMDFNTAESGLHCLNVPYFLPDGL